MRKLLTALVILTALVGCSTPSLTEVSPSTPCAPGYAKVLLTADTQGTQVTSCVRVPSPFATEALKWLDEMGGSVRVWDVA